MASAENSTIEANRALIEDYFRESTTGTIEGLFDFYTEDVVLETPGRNFMSGTHYGKSGVREYLEHNTSNFSGGVLPETTVHSILADVDYAVVVHTTRFALPKKEPFDARRVVTYGIRDGKICAVTLYEHDQYGVDNLLAG